MKLILCAMLLAGGGAIAAAESGVSSVWRCGADGRSYSDSPCPGGRAVNVDDPRSAEQRGEAREAAAREKAVARQLAQERLEREAEWRAQGPGLIAIKPLERPPALKPQAKKKPKRETSPLAARGTSASAARASRSTKG